MFILSLLIEQIFLLVNNFDLILLDSRVMEVRISIAIQVF